MHLQDLPKSGW